MNIIKKSSSLGFIAGLLLSLFTANAANAASGLNMTQTPLSLADQIPPNVMVMLDNSGSMKVRMYGGNYNNTGKYNGIFLPEKNYIYDPEIPVNASAYPSIVDTNGDTMIDTDAKGAFVESNCVPAAGNTVCWSGRFLNWVSTRRIDASRAVLVGGKLESRTATNYSTGTSSLPIAYKIVANNERSDRSISASHGSSDSYSPIADGTTINVDSPADNGNVKSKYDPYAKISAFTNTPIYNSASDIIGEFGTISLKQDYVTIDLNKSYVDPIVIAKAPSFNGGDPSVIRIKNVQSKSFQVRLQEWDYKDGNHTNEDLSFLVIEKGEHDLVDGMKIKAGQTTTDAEYVDGNCGASRTNSTTVNFASAFSSTPIVISAATTENDVDAINTRVWDIDSSSFKLALQEEETPKTAGHSSETIGYIAISPGTANDSTNNVKLEAGLVSNVNKNQKTITYSTTFTTTPAFIAAMQTKNDDDTAAIRVNSNSASSAKIHVEEEKSCSPPNENTHGDENVGYFALEGEKTSFNLAVVVPQDVDGNEPQGVLHQVKDNVRLGISFYRFELNNGDIYNGVKTDGGTLRFKIPNNPFVRKPVDASLPSNQRGYRDLEGYIGSPFDDIVDAVEHYPLIWGTTPLAENLWEVIQYFEQDDPHYPLENSTIAFEKSDVNNPGRDPYYVASYGKTLQCVNTNILIVTDGEPYRDANIPSASGGPLGFDSDSNANDIASTNPNDHGRDNLDDVAYWGFCGEPGDACKTGGIATVVEGINLRPNLRDLRTEAGMDGAQFMKIDTIAFAGSNISQILQDTADNAGGTAYNATDGDALKEAMTKVFTDAAQNASVAAISANSTRRNTDTLVYLASFNSGDWSGQLQAFNLDSNGNALATPKWSTDDDGLIPAHGLRKIFTYKLPATASSVPSGTGVEFKTYADLHPDQQADLGANETETVNNINYLRGDPTGEGSTYRVRTLVKDDQDSTSSHRRLLGDVTNSSPWFSGRFNFGYSTLPSTEGSKYRKHLTDTFNRKDAIFVGANDGMLHAFDSSTGEEFFAYVPATVIPNLTKLTKKGYGSSPAHQYFVDGSPRTGDVYYNGEWRTLLVGTMGAGGKGFFGLDVTDPETFTTDKVLFEYNAAFNSDDDLGYTLSEPTIVRMADGKWYIVLGNGYNSTSGKAVLYLIDIEKMVNGTAGSVVKLDTLVGDDNGLGTPIPVDVNGDKIVDAIYAGDLKGNMWKFDVSSTTVSDWATAFGTAATPKAMFIALDANSVPQPITAKPQVGPHADGGAMIYFGTGKFFEIGDNIVGLSPQIQSFYGIRDNFSNSLVKPVGTRSSDLVEQTIITESSTSRVTSDNSVDYSSKKGWYMDLKPPSGGNGERVISQAFLTGGRVLFSTLVPDTRPCEFGGFGWLMLVDGETGKRVVDRSFDLNNDGQFDKDDLVDDPDNDGEKVVVSGRRMGGTGGMGGITIGNNNTLTVQTNEVVNGKPVPKKIDIYEPNGTGRQSWRQLR